MARIIAVCNQKGGVGKTTTTLNLGYGLCKEGRRVLLVDLDPQSNLTMCCGIEKPDELDSTLYHLMTSMIDSTESVKANECLLKVKEMDLLPCSIELSAVEVNLVNAMSREMILRAILEPLNDKYDYILIDCMPSLGMLTINALAACDSVLITATPRYLSAKGLELLLLTIMKVKRRINKKLIIDGILITMYSNRMVLSRKIVGLIRSAYGDQIKVYENMIPTSIKVSESNYNSMSIMEYQMKNKVATAYSDFVKEYMDNEK